MDLMDPIQNNCKYGYVLPDRCRYNSITGCDCGAYPPLKPKRFSMENFDNDHPNTCRCEECRFWGA